MKYSEYGSTGKKVSAVGFGGMRFDLEKSNEENAELVRYASAQGINYFDTAPGYCEDRSEDIYGLAFKNMPNDFYVTTKAMPTAVKDAQDAYDKVRRSLDRLGVDRINFYHVWCLRKMDHYFKAMEPNGQYEGLLRCKEEGLIDHIVCSSHQPGEEIKQLLSYGSFEGILLGTNILNFPYRYEGMIEAKKRNLGVVAMNPLAGGAIPNNAEKLQFLCSNDKENPVESALRFIITNPYINVALVGFTTCEHIDTACRIASNATEMTQQELDRLTGLLGTNMNEICTGCGYCKDCPKQINIPGYMQYYNEKVMFGTEDDKLRERLDFNLNWGLMANSKGRAGDCIKCGKCETACTQHLPIISRLAEIANWEANINNEKN